MRRSFDSQAEFVFDNDFNRQFLSMAIAAAYETHSPSADQAIRHAKTGLLKWQIGKFPAFNRFFAVNNLRNFRFRTASIAARKIY